MSKKFSFAAIFLVILGLVLASFSWSGKTDSNSEQTVDSQIEPILSFSQLPERYKDIRALAWQQSSFAMNRPYQSKMGIESILSTNSKDCSIEVEEIIRDVEKVFSRALLPNKVYLLIGNSSLDKKWFEEKTRSLLSEKYISYIDGEMINPETVNDKGIGVTWVSDACNDTKGLSTEDGIEISHGFFHVIQTMQFTSELQHWGRWGEVPRWILEGGATFTQNFWRDSNSKENYLKHPMHVYDLYNLGESFYRDYFKFQAPKSKGTNEVWQYTDKWPNDRAYDAGAYMCEILVAMKGPESILNLYKQYLVSESFESAFKDIYGVTWSEAYPYLWKAVNESVNSSIKKVMPWVAEPTPSSTLFDFTSSN